MGVSVTSVNVSSGSTVSVVDTPCPTWLQALNKMPSAVMSMKTRLLDFSKAKTLQAIFVKRLPILSKIAARSKQQPLRFCPQSSQNVKFPVDQALGCGLTEGGASMLRVCDVSSFTVIEVLEPHSPRTCSSRATSKSTTIVPSMLKVGVTKRLSAHSRACFKAPGTS